MYRILELSDTHCGHRSGLTPPGYIPIDARKWLTPFWDWYTEKLAEIEKTGHIDTLVLNGDMIDGDGRKDSKLHITTDMRKQVEMAIDVAKAPQADRVFIVKGSGYHVDGQAEFEDFLADELGSIARSEVRLGVNGRLLQFRHHVGRSDTPYGQYTQVGKELTNEILQAELEEYASADVIGRSHVHYCVSIAMADGVRGRMRYAFTSPALQLRGPEQSSFHNRLRTWMYHVGMTLIEIDDTGEVFIRPIIYPIKNYMKRSYICLTSE